MPENEHLVDAEIDQPPPPTSPKGRGKLFLYLAGVPAILIVLFILLGLILYKTGVVDNYVRSSFIIQMDRMGIEFTAKRFELTAPPLVLVLEDAEFKNKVTGEHLFSIRKARLGMTILDLLALRATRDISINTTDIEGAEVWVKFDENGRSNFAELILVDDEPGSAVNFRYESVVFKVSDSIVHFGDLSRRISADANNVEFTLEPAPSDIKQRYAFHLTSSNSWFAYEDSRIDDISISSNGIADDTGADITNFTMSTPIGSTQLSGRIDDWKELRYDLAVRSDIDLTQTAAALNLSMPLTGTGSFEGKVSGSGENYRVEGEIVSRSLRAGDIYLRGTNINATVEGTNLNYEANGRAVAEMLTYEDFRIDFLKLYGNVRGTGTDFRWVGELQAAAVAADKLSIAGLFLSDARAELRDRELRASAGNARAQRFALGDAEFDGLRASGLQFDRRGTDLRLTSRSAQARSFKTNDFALSDVSGRNLSVRGQPGGTTVEADSVRSSSAVVGGTRATGVTADRFRYRDLPRSTEVTARNLRADRIVENGTVVTGVEAPDVSITDNAAGTVIFSDRVRVARIDTGAASLGSLNVAGVRLSIRQGRIEARSNDIDAGDITLARSASLPDGGVLSNVRINRPVFIVQPSGQYRASADMSIGGGAVGSISLGEARSSVIIENGRAVLGDVSANVMDGSVVGRAVIAFDNRSRSELRGQFTDLDLSKIISVTGGRVTPLDGKTTGTVDLEFRGTDFRTASGSLDAAITANAGAADAERIAINGQVRLNAVSGLFTVETADIRTPESTLTASGRFDLRAQNSDLRLALRSTDANEIDRLFRLLAISPDIEQQLDSLRARFGGTMSFDGTITGNLYEPNIDGRASIASVSLRGREIGAVAADIAADTFGLAFTNGRLAEPGGGEADFAVNIPFSGANNITVTGELRSMETARILSALPIDLPERIADLSGKASGTINITGLPNEARGLIDINAKNGMIAGNNFDSLDLKANFLGTKIDIETARMRIGSGEMSVDGSYDRASEEFDLTFNTKAFPLAVLLAVMPPNDSIPAISGNTDVTARATGIASRTATYNVSFNGAASNVIVGDQTLGTVKFNGNTADGILIADVIADLNGQKQVLIGSVNFAEPTMPVNISTNFDQSPIAPFLVFIPQLRDFPITGTGTGRVSISGPLVSKDSEGNNIFSADGISGDAEFTQLALQIQDTPLSAVETVRLRFNAREIVFESAKFAGGGSNMTVSGRKALAANVVNDLSIDGRVNLRLLNLVAQDTFFTGFADTSVKLTGTNANARLFGNANIVNGSVATFLGTDRFTIDRVQARLIFTSDQVELESATGYLGGGRFTASGGGFLDGLSVRAFRFALDGNNVTVPLPKDFLTTGDARLEITGVRSTPAAGLQMTVAGRVIARRSLYSKDIDLANLIGGRRDTTLSAGGGGGSLTAPRFDLVIEGRDALVVKNNIADLTASISLSLTGDADNPRISGRITANSGTIFFRRERYQVQRGVLEFPPDTGIEPVINLQAETDIAGYQIYVNISGPLTDTELLAANVRSSPALPQADIVSLITTGTLANSAGGIPTLAQSGINTAAEVLTDSIINNPARRATDRLFGLNVFEVDPIISGQQGNPSARLTVGRQINNNLRVTYSTNLSQDQNQILALEYRVSNRLSFVAQYEQRSLSNVTRTRDNFSIEIRFRKRF
jgi:translocation and assembly module TamB